MDAAGSLDPGPPQPGRLHRHRHIPHGQAVPGNGIAVEMRPQDWHVGLLFHRQIHHPGHGLHDLARLFGQQPQLVEVVPEDLHRDFGLHAFEQFVKSHLDGLRHDHRLARHVHLRRRAHQRRR